MEEKQGFEMAQSKMEHGDAISPFSLWETAYDFLRSSIHNWVYKLFEKVINPNGVLAFVTEFTTLMINLLTSGITIFSVESKIIMSIAGAGFFVNFNLAFLKISSLFPDFQPREAMRLFFNYVVEYKEGLKDTIFPNSDEAEESWMKHIKSILTAFFSAIIGALGYLSDGTKGIANAFRLITMSKSGIESVQSVVERTIDNLVLGKADPIQLEREAVLELVEKGQEYLKLTLGQIASKNEIRRNIREFTHDATKSLASYRSPETNSLRSMLVGIIRDLSKKMEEIDQSIPFRQVTSGVFLMGNKGVGKSSLVNYLTQRLAQRFHLQNKLYSVSTGIRFYEPYLNEDFGIVNEFGSATKEESFVYDSNRICSSDPFNFESASLAGKVGSCQLKMLFVTSNVTNPDVPELRTHAIPAFWDRFIIVEVVDPSIVDRRSVYSHRKPDFSHLKFSIKLVSQEDNKALEFVDLMQIGIVELLDLLSSKLAMETKKYYDAIGEPMDLFLEDAVEHFINTDNIPTSDAYFQQHEYIPNAGGRNFCIMRIQGMEGTGKTSTALWLADKWTSLTKNFNNNPHFCTQISTTISEFIPKGEPCVYILDDWLSLSLTTEELQQFVEKMNKTHHESVFLVTTNEVITKLRYYNQILSRTYSALCGMDHHYPYDLRSYTHVYSGVFRRIGLDDYYMVGSELHKVNSTNYCAVLNVDYRGCYKYKNHNISNYGMLEQLKNNYIAMQRDKFELTVIREKPISEDIDVDMELICDDAEVLFSKLKTAVGAASLYLSPSAKASLTVSDRIKKGATSLGRAVKPADFICDEIFSDDIPKTDRYITIVQRMVRVLLQYYEQPTFRIIIKDTKEVIYSKESIVYYYVEDTSAYIVTELDHVKIMTDVPKKISAKEFAIMLCEEKMEDKFEGSSITIAEYAELEAFYRREIKKSHYDYFILEVARHEQDILKRKTETYLRELQIAKNCKLLKIALCGLVGISSIGALYGLYKIISNAFSKSDIIEANSFANVGSTPPQRMENSQARYNKKKLGVTDNIIKHVPIEVEREEILEANSEYDKVKPHKRSKVYMYANDVEEEIEANSEYTKQKPSKRSKIYIHANTKDHNKEAHTHICRYCGCYYSHIHHYNKAAIHPQWKRQCPNEECSNYLGEEDKYSTILIEKEYQTVNSSVASPSELIKMIGESCSPIYDSLLRTFASFSEQKRLTIHDKLNQAREKDLDMIEVLKQYTELDAIIKDSVVANMLTDEDMIKTEETDLETLHRQLRRSYARITVGQHSAYAIHVGNGFFLTISHCFDEVGEQAILSSAGIRHSAVCVALLRNRDISVVLCKQLSNLPSAKRYFVEDSNDLDHNGYFIRCGPNFEVISGALEYKAYQGHLEGRSNIGDKYAPTTEVLKIRRLGLECAKVIKRGDCGFPFVCRVGSTMRVVGFHNAYKLESCFFGAFINKSLIADLCDITIANSDQLSSCAVVAIPAIINTELSTITVSMPVEYVNAIETSIKPDPLFPKSTDTSSLLSVGYNQKFKSWNKQKEKHSTHDLQLINKNMTLPAAYNLTYVEDTSDLVLDGMGKPNPLWTQACKYNLNQTDYDADCFEHAVELCYDYNKLTYAEKPFRILTEFEAINGCRKPFLSNVDISTSAGPYAKYFGGIFRKNQIFDTVFHDNQPIYTFNNTKVAQNIRNHLKEQVKLLEQKFIPPCLISQDNAKVENISAEKAKKGKVRLFNNVDPNVNAILKKYFGDWFAHIMEKHQEGYYAVGQDPYTTSTEIYHAFEAKQGKVLNTDFSAFDKLLTPELIRAFCKIASRLTKPKPDQTHDELYSVFMALASTLTHAVHLLNGSIYIVNNGNESGTFVTTMLNCVAVHIVFNYTFIKMWWRVPKYINILPTLKDIMERSEIRILGDDKTQKVSYEIPMEEEDLIAIASELGMKCTPAKGDTHVDGEINFCSRVLVWDAREQVVFPRLKKESINGLLYWFASFSINQVRDNLMVALFEACFYDQQYYENVLADAIIVAKNFKVDIRTVPFTNYRQARRRLVSFMMNDVECQDISALTDRETIYITEDISRLIKKHLLSEDNSSINKIKDSALIESLTSKKATLSLNNNTTTDEGKMALNNCSNNPISQCLELIAKLKAETPRESFGKTGPEHCPTYTCELTFENHTFGGEGSSKVDAKKQAYGALRHFLRDNIVPNSGNKDGTAEANQAIQKISFRFTTLYIEEHIRTAKENADGKRYVKLNGKTSGVFGMENVNGFYCYYSNGFRYVVSAIFTEIGSKTTATCYKRYPGITVDNVTREITLDTHQPVSTWDLRQEDRRTYSDDETLVYANSLRRIASVLEASVRNDIIIPNSDDKPPALGVVNNDNPMVVPTAAILASDKEIVKPTIMNYSAPSTSWLGAGGIMHNIFDLIYNQFLWSTQFLVESTADRGKIIMQIPYTPVNNSFASSFIMNALMLHGRFSGDWIVRLTCPGSASGMQGAIIVSWQPHKIEGTTANMEELTKYSYFTESIATPWTQDIIMRDARKDSFYREVPRKSNATTSDAKQPHIVIAVESPGVSTFKESNKVYISVASKLCSQKDQLLNPAVKPFVMADPQNSLKYDSTKGYTLNF